MTVVEPPRKIPSQTRALRTVDDILEAALQLLERDGEKGFNTNAVAERAGVSIGTLYRYFPDKGAILAALASREMDQVHEAMLASLRGESQALAPDRAAIRAFLHAFEGRTRARRVVIAALIANADPQDLTAGYGPVEAAIKGPDGKPLSPIVAFVLTRATQGVMRAAVMEGADFLLDREFEDELVRLGRAYLKAPRAG